MADNSNGGPWGKVEAIISRCVQAIVQSATGTDDLPPTLERQDSVLEEVSEEDIPKNEQSEVILERISRLEYQQRLWKQMHTANERDYTARIEELTTRVDKFSKEIGRTNYLAMIDSLRGHIGNEAVDQMCREGIASAFEHGSDSFRRGLTKLVEESIAQVQTAKQEAEAVRLQLEATRKQYGAINEQLELARQQYQEQSKRSADQTRRDHERMRRDRRVNNRFLAALAGFVLLGTVAGVLYHREKSSTIIQKRQSIEMQALSEENQRQATQITDLTTRVGNLTGELGQYQKEYQEAEMQQDKRINNYAFVADQVKKVEVDHFAKLTEKQNEIERGLTETRTSVNTLTLQLNSVDYSPDLSEVFIEIGRLRESDLEQAKGLDSLRGETRKQYGNISAKIEKPNTSELRLVDQIKNLSLRTEMAENQIQAIRNGYVNPPKELE